MCACVYSCALAVTGAVGVCVLVFSQFKQHLESLECGQLLAFVEAALEYSVRSLFVHRPHCHSVCLLGPLTVRTPRAAVFALDLHSLFELYAQIDSTEHTCAHICAFESVAPPRSCHSHSVLSVILDSLHVANIFLLRRRSPRQRYGLSKRSRSCDGSSLRCAACCLVVLLYATCYEGGKHSKMNFPRSPHL